jgi:hypothetical protein
MSRDRHGRPDTIGGMVGVGRQMAACFIIAAALASCRRAPEAIPPPASLPRDRITFEQRAGWRAHLRWPDACEDSFRASHAGDSGGVTVTPLPAGRVLVEVTCAAGSYQPSAIRFDLPDGAGPPGEPLSFPVYTSEDGRELSVTREIEVWGESEVNGEAGEITILSLARQTGDCGVWARYSLNARPPRLIAAAARVECPATPGAPARWSASEPPPGWPPVPRKD